MVSIHCLTLRFGGLSCRQWWIQAGVVEDGSLLQKVVTINGLQPGRYLASLWVSYIYNNILPSELQHGRKQPSSVNLVVSSLPFEPDELVSNPVQSTEFSGVITALCLRFIDCDCYCYVCSKISWNLPCTICATSLWNLPCTICATSLWIVSWKPLFYYWYLRHIYVQ